MGNIHVESDSFGGVVEAFDPFPEQQSPEPNPSSWGGSLKDMPNPYAPAAAAVPSEPFSRQVDGAYHPLAGLDPTHSIGRQFDPVLTPEAVAQLSDTDRARLEAHAQATAVAANATIGEYGTANPHTRNVAIAAARMALGLQALPQEQREVTGGAEALNG